MSGRVVVLGSVNLDLTARTAVLPRRGETVTGLTFTRSPGGKGANQAVAAARAGGEVTLCGAVGNDAFGNEAVSSLSAEGVNTNWVMRVSEATGVALVLVEDSGENEIVVVSGANARAHGRGVPLRKDDVAVAVLEVPAGAVEVFFEEARVAGALTLLNAVPAPQATSRLMALADVVCANEHELDSLRSLTGGGAFVITRGARGVQVVDWEGELTVPGHPIEVVDTVGAGDATCGVLAASLAAGLPLRESARRANAAGALAVRRAGARTSPTAREIDTLLGEA